MPIKLFVALWLLICMSASADDQPQDKPEYVIGLTTQGIRVAAVEDVELGFNYQLDQITKDKSYLMKIKVFQNDDQLTNMLQERKITGYFGSPLLLVRHQHAFNLNALYTPMLNNAVLQRYVLLVRKDSAINHLSDLKDKSLSYCVVDEVGMMYLQKSLNDQKLGDIHAFFNKTIIKKNPNLAVSALFFKEVQATVVLEADFMVAAELNPQLKQQLVSIQISPEYVTNVLAISNRLDGPMSIAEYENNVLHIGSAIQSKKLLKTYNYGKLRKIKKEDLDTVVELIHSLYPTKGTTSR